MKHPNKDRDDKAKIVLALSAALNIREIAAAFQIDESEARDLVAWGKVLAGKSARSDA